MSDYVSFHILILVLLVRIFSASQLTNQAA